jgi:hypothetical protein
MRPLKTWGPVEGRGHAVFGWPMEEEAKLEFTITVNWRRKEGSMRRRNWGRWTAALAAQLAAAKLIPGRLQEIVVSEQLQRYCEAAVRPCPRCHRRCHLRRRHEKEFKAR